MGFYPKPMRSKSAITFSSFRAKQAIILGPSEPNRLISWPIRTKQAIILSPFRAKQAIILTQSDLNGLSALVHQVLSLTPLEL